MHHDMKNFSDITAIETDHALDIRLSYRVHGRCVFNVSINDYQIKSSESIRLNLFDNILLKVELLDFDEGTSGIEIEHFSINELEILPKYQHLSNNKKCYVDNLGLWYFETSSPFYPWYHQITGRGWIA